MEYISDQQELVVLTDKEIIRHIIAGNSRLYELIVRKHNARLYRIGMSLMNNPQDVEDVMQTAYVNAYEHLRDFSGKSKFSTWLTRIFINENFQRLKERKRRLTMQTDRYYINRSIAGSIAQLPEKAMLNQELRNVLEDALAQLPEKYRIVFVLREVENLSVAETMEALSLSESNVKVRLSRAKAALREQLASYYRSDGVYHFHLSRCDIMVARVFSKLGIDR
jgi:RNA polymerase sigma-70 factor (ECF subfamily)